MSLTFLSTDECDATAAEATEDESESSIMSDSEDTSLQNQVVARSKVGTAFYLFNYQAGGHKPFLRSACGEVCKPAIPLELQFYQSLDTRYPQLKHYVPAFVGVISVDLHPKSKKNDPPTRQNNNGTAGDFAMPRDSIDTEQPSSDQLESLSAVVAGNTPGKKRRLGGGPTVGSSYSSHKLSPTRLTTSYSAKLWHKERSSSETKRSGVQQTNSFSGLSHEYLVLGDLTHKYSRPCVLDIKMGTRQHGDDATPAKAKSHSIKCAATTSFTLGLRICGMQIYDETEQRYTLCDKHWGRQLKDDDIEPALTTYISNGSGVHWDSLEALLVKLENLKQVIATTTGVRFWGASLLLIYEGDLRNATRHRVDVHLIDFAHCQVSDEIVTADEGLLLGLNNMATFLSNILARRSVEKQKY